MSELVSSDLKCLFNQPITNFKNLLTLPFAELNKINMEYIDGDSIGKINIDYKYDPKVPSGDKYTEMNTKYKYFFDTLDEKYSICNPYRLHARSYEEYKQTLIFAKKDNMYMFIVHIYIYDERKESAEVYITSHVRDSFEEIWKCVHEEYKQKLLTVNSCNCESCAERKKIILKN
jgi:hypothetical protein